MVIDADNAEEGKEPRPFTPAFFCACTVALIWTVVLLIFLEAKISDVAAVAGTLGSVVATGATLLGIFQPPKLPTPDRKNTRRIVAFILFTDFLLSGVWAGWSWYKTNRTIPLYSFTLSQASNVLPEGDHAALDLVVGAQRDTIVLVFEVVDHRPDLGSCLPNTLLLVTPVTSGNRGSTVSTSSGDPTVVDLPVGTTKVHLDIAVRNTRGDLNCGVDLSVVSAKLQNK